MGLEHGRTENCGVARCGIWLATSSGCLRGGGSTAGAGAPVCVPYATPASRRRLGGPPRDKRNEENAGRKAPGRGFHSSSGRG